MSALRMIYLGLALWGAIFPMYYFVTWGRENSLSLTGLIEAWQANAATSGLAWDLIIAAIALSIWAIAETRVRRNWVALWALPVTLFIGVSCGLPLYLFLRTRAKT
ncbi:MAG: hypothetical protein ACJA06_000635 [Halocynthiibacter sp.]|jgi:hypothetical protein